MQNIDFRAEDRVARQSSLAATLAAANQAWPESARQQMTQMVDQIARSDANIGKIIGTKQSPAIKAGFAAEEVHAECRNLDADLARKWTPISVKSGQAFRSYVDTFFSHRFIRFALAKIGMRIYHRLSS